MESAESEGGGGALAAELDVSLGEDWLEVLAELVESAVADGVLALSSGLFSSALASAVSCGTPSVEALSAGGTSSGFSESDFLDELQDTIVANRRVATASRPMLLEAGKSHLLSRIMFAIVDFMT